MCSSDGVRAVAALSRRLVSAIVRGIIPRSSGGCWLGWVGGGAWVSVWSRVVAALTAQMRYTARELFNTLTSTVNSDLPTAA